MTLHLSENLKTLAAIAISTLLMLSCEYSPRVPTETANTQPSPASNTAPSPSRTPVEITITLPIIDALLADEAFVNEARSAGSLTDEEIQKLRDAARNEILRLSDDPSEDALRSTRAATARAKKQVQQALGTERSIKFLELAQARWLSSDQQLNIQPNQVPDDTRVVVNAPAYRMDIFNGGRLVKSYRIGIGYPEFPLPTGLRKIKTIIFNPEWTPPDEPWVKGKFQPGRKVEAGDKLNPLGVIKIPIGLPSLIHGGKQPARLGNFASHGCVGLTNAQVQDFAKEISSIAGQPVSLEDIKAFQKKKDETEEVKLPQEIPVELRYETIVLENGVLKIYRDVYEKGTNTEENLRRVLDHVGISFHSLPPDLKQAILDGLGQMAIDAGGEPVDAESKEPESEKKDRGDGRVTRNVKGTKELSFEIPGAGGKGYPAPATS
jgi:lipoprotein-anchoring transpeptidase ErfK/SrfK